MNTYTLISLENYEGYVHIAISTTEIKEHLGRYGYPIITHVTSYSTMRSVGWVEQKMVTVILKICVCHLTGVKLTHYKIVSV